MSGDSSKIKRQHVTFPRYHLSPTLGQRLYAEILFSLFIMGLNDFWRVFVMDKTEVVTFYAFIQAFSRAQWIFIL